MIIFEFDEDWMIRSDSLVEALHDYCSSLLVVILSLTSLMSSHVISHNNMSPKFASFTITCSFTQTIQLFSYVN